MLCNLTDISDPSGPKNRRAIPASVLAFAEQELEASTPSIGRSMGTLSEAPARAANVLYQSWPTASPRRSPGRHLPGQRTIAGTRIEPSEGGVKKSPRQGRSNRRIRADGREAALSLENTMIVLSAIPA